jgi:uncharacterized protein (DUF3820 family)
MADFEILKDDSLMPYGRHRGKKMKDVPIKDLVWLIENGRCSMAVVNYMMNNWVAICKEMGRMPDINNSAASVRRKWRRN